MNSSIIAIAQREADRAADQAQTVEDAAAIYFETVTETRERGYRAEEILAAGLVSPNGRAGSYYVESQNGGGRYTVDLEARTCDCPDHIHRGTYCKHLQAAEMAAARWEALRRRQELEAVMAPYSDRDPFAPDYEALGRERVTSQYRDSLDAAGMEYGGRWTDGQTQDYIDWARDV